MNARDAEDLLSDADLIPCLEGSLPYAKEVVQACLEDEIPAILYRDDHCKKGCSPKVQVLVREADVPRVAALLDRRWKDLADQEGAGRIHVATDAETEHPPCPACGHVGALGDDGACAECGLVLG